MEIERKFLTKEIPFDLSVYPVQKISQCYISVSPTIRLRACNDAYILTVKGKGTIAREEFELKITQAEYESLLQKAETPTISKRRYLVTIGQERIAEVDVYEGALSGLITTEIEFTSIEDAKNYIPPDWVGKDVSQDVRYQNTNLSKYGIPVEI